MTFASERRVHDIDASDLALPEHKLAEKLGTAIVLLLIASVGLLLLDYEALGWFVGEAILFAVVVAFGLRWAERKGGH